MEVDITLGEVVDLTKMFLFVEAVGSTAEESSRFELDFLIPVFKVNRKRLKPGTRLGKYVLTSSNSYCFMFSECVRILTLPVCALHFQGISFTICTCSPACLMVCSSLDLYKKVGISLQISSLIVWFFSSNLFLIWSWPALLPVCRENLNQNLTCEFYPTVWME